MALKIALDYDGTYNADKELWDSFIEFAAARGHEVVITTSKTKEDMTWDKLPRRIGGMIYGLSGLEREKKHKHEYDIWIDNGGIDRGKDKAIPQDTNAGGAEGRHVGTEEAGVVGPEATGNNGEVTDPTNDGVTPSAPKRGRKPRVPS